MRAARIIEIAVWSCGLLLIAGYVGVRSWSLRESDSGVEAMRQARLEHVAQQRVSNHVASNALQTSQPDTSLWNAKRIAQYQTTLTRKDLPEGVLRIPALKLEIPVYEGTSDFTLNRGAGRIAGTARIDSVSGNIGIAAHRDGFFRPLKDIQIGDRLFLDTVSATREYRVTRLDIVEPTDIGVLASTSDAQITLVTCYPFYFVGDAPQRFIVHAQAQPAG